MLFLSAILWIFYQITKKHGKKPKAAMPLPYLGLAIVFYIIYKLAIAYAQLFKPIDYFETITIGHAALFIAGILAYIGSKKVLITTRGLINALNSGLL